MSSSDRDELLREASRYKLRAMRLSMLGEEARDEHWEAITLYHRAAQLELEAAGPTHDLPESERTYAGIEACGLFLDAGDPLRAAQIWMRFPIWLFTRKAVLLNELKPLYNKQLSSFISDWQALKNKPIEELSKSKLEKMTSHFPGMAELWWALSKRETDPTLQNEARAKAIALNPAMSDEQSALLAWQQIDGLLCRTYKIKIEAEKRNTPLGFHLVSAIASHVSEFLSEFLEKTFGGDDDLVPLRGSPGSYTFEVGSHGIPIIVLELLKTLLHEAPENIGVHRLKALLSLLEAHSMRLSMSFSTDAAEDKRLLIDQTWRRKLLDTAELAIRNRIDSKDIPQADDLTRVFRIVELLATHKEINEQTLDVSPRQVNYYRRAAKILGLVSESDELTGAGILISRLRGQERLAATVIQFETSICGEAWIRWSKGRSLRDVEPDSAYDFLSAKVPGLSAETADRRAQTLISWHRALIAYHYIPAN